jgi:hypothetical protein
VADTEFEIRLYRNVQNVLRTYGERLLSAGYRIRRVDAEKMKLLSWFLSGHELREGDVLSPYESEGYYLVRGADVTGQEYAQWIDELEDEVKRREGGPQSAEASGRKQVQLADARDLFVEGANAGKIKVGDLTRRCRRYLHTHAIEGKPNYTAEKLVNLVVKRIDKLKGKGFPGRR